MTTISITGDTNDTKLVLGSVSGTITDGPGNAGLPGPPGPPGPAGPLAHVVAFQNKAAMETKLRTMMESKVNTVNGGESTPWAIQYNTVGDDKSVVAVGFDADQTDMSGGVQDQTKPANEDTICRIFSQTKAVTAAAMMCMERDNVLHHEDSIQKYLLDFSGVALKVIRPGLCLDVSGVTVDAAFDAVNAKIVESSGNVIDLSGFVSDPSQNSSDLLTNQNYALTVGTSRCYFELEAAIRPLTLTHLATHTDGLHNYGLLFANNLLVGANGSKFNSNVIQNKLQGLSLFDFGGPGSSKAMVEKCAKVGLLTHQPGEQFAYGIGLDILGEALTRVFRNIKSDNTLDLQDVFDELIFNPLGMIDSFFYRDASNARFTDSYDRYLPAVAFSGNNTVGWTPLGKDLVSVNYGQYGSTFTFMDLKGWNVLGGQGLMSTAKEYGMFLRFLLTGKDKDGNVLVPKQLLNSYVREIKSSYGADEAALGPDYGYGISSWVTYASTLIGRVFPDGRIISDDGLVNQLSTNNPNEENDGENLWWGGAAGTTWSLDFTNDSTHQSFIQRSGSDTPYNRASGAGYAQFLEQEGMRICSEHMTGDGDYHPNNAGFERSVADELYALKQRIAALESV
jgi:CubicO group peptidase (beta-lactamase class C family)